jgi:hypothetical protein
MHKIILISKQLCKEPEIMELHGSNMIRMLRSLYVIENSMVFSQADPGALKFHDYHNRSLDINKFVIK